MKPMYMDVAAESSGEYELLDAGKNGRLERFGSQVLDRPCPMALWEREHPDLWSRAEAVYHRTSSGGGDWTFPRPMPASWTIRWQHLDFIVKPTSFGHTGLFPEHAAHGDWMARSIRSGVSPCRVLNLFAYTGAMTLLAAKAGAEVCHVDAVKDTNAWARRNAEINGLSGAPIRWITDDVMKFVARELRRNRRYEGIIIDPPSYGRGPEGEKWSFEDDLPELINRLTGLMSARPLFLLFTSHTTGSSAPFMKNMLLKWQDRFGGGIDAGNMLITHRNLRHAMPAGFYSRWTGPTAAGHNQV